jgi:hypothetical protein
VSLSVADSTLARPSSPNTATAFWPVVRRMVLLVVQVIPNAVALRTASACSWATAADADIGTSILDPFLK